MVPYHTIAFSQQKLRTALRRSADHDPGLNYGFVIHARRHNERPSLGIISLQGESLALTEHLLASLEKTPIWLFGHARVTLGVGERISELEERSRRHPDKVPLSALLMHIATFDANAGMTQNLVQVEAIVKADTLVQPLLLLTPYRPAAWPL